MPLEFIINQKGGKNLNLEGFIYTYHRKSEEKVTWRCVNYNTKKCRARVCTSNMEDDGVVLSTTEHNHLPNVAKVQSCKVMANIRDMASTSNMPTSRVISNAVRNISQSTAGQLTSRSNISRTIRRIRADKKIAPANPTTIAQLVIGDEYKNTAKDELFLCCDSRDHQVKCKERFLIFATQQNLNLLRSCDRWYADGTFRTVPNIFYQLYTIHGSIKGRVMPFVYVLVTGKSKSAYVSILRQLCTLEPRLKPQVIMADFELAFMTAAKKVFPDCTIKGCVFHYSQCILRKIRSCGLHDLYSRDGDNALHMKMFYALAYVPVANVISVYESMIKMPFFVNHEDELSEFLDYMENTWIGKLTRRGERQRGTYDIAVWNHYQSTVDEVERTNNAIEGWHNAFNIRVQNAHVTIWAFIEFLRDEQASVEFELEQIAGGEGRPTKKRKYQNHDRRLLNVVKSWDTVEQLEYLRGVAHNLEY